MKMLILSLVLINYSTTFAESMVLCGSYSYPSSSIGVPYSMAQNDLNKNLKSIHGGLEINQLEVTVKGGIIWSSVTMCVSASKNASIIDSTVVCGSDSYPASSINVPYPTVQYNLNEQLRSLGNGYQLSDRKTTLIEGILWSSLSICVLANKK